MAVEHYPILEDPNCTNVPVRVVREIFADLRDGVNESVAEGCDPYAAAAWVRTQNGLVRLVGARSNNSKHKPGFGKQKDHAEERLLHALPPHNEMKSRWQNNGDRDVLKHVGVVAINHPPCQNCALSLMTAGFTTIICGPQSDTEVDLDPSYNDFFLSYRRRIHTVVFGVDGDIGAEQVHLGRSAVNAGTGSAEMADYMQAVPRFQLTQPEAVASEKLRVWTDNFSLTMIYPTNHVTELGDYAPFTYAYDISYAIRRIAELTGRSDMSIERHRALQTGQPDPGISPLEQRKIDQVLSGEYRNPFEVSR